MSPNFTRTILVALSIFTFNLFAANSQTTYNNYGGNTTYPTLQPGDSLIIHSGTYTGNVSSWTSGSVILVKSGATFNPDSYGNHVSKVVVAGTAIIKNFSALQTFTLENYGHTTFISQYGGGQQLTNNSKINNYFGATLVVNSNFALNAANNVLMNQGTITITGKLSINSGSKVINKKSLTIGGDQWGTDGIEINNGSTLDNQGSLNVTKRIAINQNSQVSNSCRFISQNGIVLNNGAVLNSTGLIWASNASNNSFFTNNSGGTVNLSGAGTIKSVNFTNYGTIAGNGYLYLTGHTIGQGSFTGGTIYVNETSRTNSNPAYIFDVQYSTFPAIQFSNFTAPDTVSSFATCAPEEAPLPLAVKWESFNTNLTNNVPVLDWKVSFDNQTDFEVQRSYDGITFNTIAVVFSVNNVNSYQYKDEQVNTNNKVVYYRINAKELNGETKLSDTRTVRFSNNTKNISLQVVPNPFVNQVQVQYQATENETITIRIVGTNGQALVTKNAGVSKGFNAIAVTEAGNLVKGVYFLQVISNNKIVATEKVVKQ